MPASKQKQSGRQGTDCGRNPSQKENKLHVVKAVKRDKCMTRPSVDSFRRTQRPLGVQQLQLEAATAEMQPTLKKVHERIMRQFCTSSPPPDLTERSHHASPATQIGRQNSPELDSAAFKGFVEEVAARIIQTYWRKLKATRAPFPSEVLVPRPSAPIPHSTSPKQAPLECADRDLSSRSSLDNIEALMNRYRQGRPPSRTSQRSDQDAVQHAVSILRAAGMKVAGDSEGLKQDMAEKAIDDPKAPRSHHLDNCTEGSKQGIPAGGLCSPCTVSQGSKSHQGGHLGVATVGCPASPQMSDHQSLGPAAPYINIRERINGIRAGHVTETGSRQMDRTPTCTDKHLLAASAQCLAQEVRRDRLIEVGSVAGDQPQQKLSSILDYLDTVSHQADEEAGLVMEQRSKSSCSTSHGSRQPRAPYGVQTLPPHKVNGRTDEMSITHILDTALTEHELDLPLTTASTLPREQGQGISFCEEVRRRVKKMQQELQAREQAVASLNVQIKSLQCAHSEECKQLKQAHDSALAGQKDESEAALKRHLDLIDRLLADKDALSRQVDDAKDQLASLDAKHADTVSAMKAGWAQELRKQKDGWVAAEKGKREGWLADKTKEIKDATIKGLEPEIQALVQKHRSEIGDLKETWKQDTKRQMDAMRDQHEAYVRQIRERMLHEREVAVEGERAAAQKRLSDAAERYEASAQQARMHLAADHERRLGEAEDAWRMQRRDLLDKVKKLEQLHEDLEADKSNAVLKVQQEERQKHNAAVKSLKEEYDAENQAWRRAIADKARKQLADKESELRNTLEAERDRQIELVIQKFDGEMAGKAQKLMDKHSSELAGLKAQHEIALSEALGSQKRYSERHREASTALQAAQDRADAAQDQAKYLKDIVADQDGRLKSLEQQVKTSDQECDKKLRDQQQMLSAQHATVQDDLKSVKSELATSKEQLTCAVKENQTLRQRQADELDRVEHRVKAAIQRKDETIASLRSQLTELNEQMRNAEDILTLE